VAKKKEKAKKEQNKTLSRVTAGAELPKLNFLTWFLKQ
jgi:hypothetical protein